MNVPDGEIKFHQLKELCYAEPVKGDSYQLYLFDVDGFHSGGQWFTSTLPLKFPEEEITLDEAHQRCIQHLARGLEVRITNGGDYLVYHAIGDRNLYGSDDIWKLL